ncbi:PREDICTED: nucleosome assembly protein 1;3-like [Branchiostoma belcheri]|uniref:Nucleosome assembly protein 13-like n=1 Tax=Branchiostoma belcheri TaxID=7741 RepID=A0A6P4Y868_BRABE|nr:PREDICTED: nucleosome assembly protein 1;3-like [Branchiostoma belcheri]
MGFNLRPSVLKNKDKAELEQLTEQLTSTPSAAGVVTGTSPQKPPRLHHGGDTGETTDPVPLPETARCEGFVLYRDRLGEWFRFLADDDVILDQLFGDGEELHRLYCCTGAVEKQATLPVGRLIAIDGLSVRGLTDSELLDVLNTSVDPVISIDPLDFEMTTPTTLQSLISEPVPTDEEESSDEESSDEDTSDEEPSDEESSDEESSDEDTSDDEESSEVEESSEDEESCEDEEETQENGDTQQQVRPVRKWRRVAAFFSRCRRAFTSCWRH